MQTTFFLATTPQTTRMLAILIGNFIVFGIPAIIAIVIIVKAYNYATYKKYTFVVDCVPDLCRKAGDNPDFYIKTWTNYEYKTWLKAKGLRIYKDNLGEWKVEKFREENYALVEFIEKERRNRLLAKPELLALSEIKAPSTHVDKSAKISAKDMEKVKESNSKLTLM